MWCQTQRKGHRKKQQQQYKCWQRQVRVQQQICHNLWKKKKQKTHQESSSETSYRQPKARMQTVSQSILNKKRKRLSTSKTGFRICTENIGSVTFNCYLILTFDQKIHFLKCYCYCFQITTDGICCSNAPHTTFTKANVIPLMLSYRVISGSEPICLNSIIQANASSRPLHSSLEHHLALLSLHTRQSQSKLFSE